MLLTHLSSFSPRHFGGPEGGASGNGGRPASHWVPLAERVPVPGGTQWEAGGMERVLRWDQWRLRWGQWGGTHSPVGPVGCQWGRTHSPVGPVGGATHSEISHQERVLSFRWAQWDRWGFSGRDRFLSGTSLVGPVGEVRTPCSPPLRLRAVLTAQSRDADDPVGVTLGDHAFRYVHRHGQVAGEPDFQSHSTGRCCATAERAFPVES